MPDLVANAFLILIALLLDRKFGDPDWLWSRIPHPVSLMGRLIALAEERWNVGGRKFWKGAGALAAGCLAMFALGTLLSVLPGHSLVEMLLAAVLLAQKSLIDHVLEVAAGLRLNLSHGRRAAARIVGRDVEDLDGGEVSKAAVESAAEGFADGVVAPAFWFLLFGLPGILVCKFVNTADSMIGYRDDRHAEFGRATARLDDALNWIPARIAGFVILACGGRLARFRQVAADARAHLSPNAGWPEAAMAVVLGISLGGPRTRDGETRDIPRMNATGRAALETEDIDDAVWIVRKAHLLLTAAVGIILLAALVVL